MSSKAMREITEVERTQPPPPPIHFPTAPWDLGFLLWLGPGAPTLPSAKGPAFWRADCPPLGEQPATKVVGRVRLVWRPPRLGSKVRVGEASLPEPAPGTHICLPPSPSSRGRPPAKGSSGQKLCTGKSQGLCLSHHPPPTGISRESPSLIFPYVLNRNKSAHHVCLIGLGRGAGGYPGCISGQGVQLIARASCSPKLFPPQGGPHLGPILARGWVVWDISGAR